MAIISFLHFLLNKTPIKKGTGALKFLEQ